MSSIVGINCEGKSYLGVDQQVSYGNHKEIVKGSKIFTFANRPKGLLMGQINYIAICGSAVIKNYLQSFITNCEGADKEIIDSEDKLFDFMIEFYNYCKNKLNYLPDKQNEIFPNIECWGIYINSNHQMFKIDGSFFIRRIENNFVADGSGRDYILGYLEGNRNWSVEPLESIIGAISTAAKYDKGTGRKIEIISSGRTDCFEYDGICL